MGDVTEKPSQDRTPGRSAGKLLQCCSGYALAAAAVAVGWALFLGVTALAGPDLPPYITFYPAVVAAALLGGPGPGLLATGLAALAADYWLLPPAGFGIAHLRDGVGLGLFTVNGAVICAIAALYRRVRVKAAAYDREMAVREAGQRAVQALHQSQDDLKRAQAVGQIGSWRLDVRRNELTWSEENHRIFGIPPGTPLSYETFLSAVHPDDRDYVDRKWQAGLRGEPYDIEHRLVVAGRVKWVRERAELEFGPQGELLGGFGTTQDITARKRVEIQLAASRQRLAGIVESAMDAIITVGADQRIILFNSAAEQMFRCPAAQAIGTSIGRFIPERSRAMHERHVQAFGNGGTTQRRMGRLGELTGLRSDGEEFPIEASISTIAVGGERLFTVILRDVTERQRAEESRRASVLARSLIEVQEAERRRLAQALHDTTSPNLAAIGLNLDIVAQELLPQEPARIRARMEDTRALLTDTAAGIRDVCFDLRPASLDYLGLLPAVESYADQLAKRTGIDVRVRAQGFTNHLSTVQEVLLFRIIQEALTNCAKHSGASSIDVVFAGGDPRLRITIADDGVGFDQASPGGPAKTPGLGLLTMRERAEYAGGTLTIETQPAGGTRVALEI